MLTIDLTYKVAFVTGASKDISDFRTRFSSQEKTQRRRFYDQQHRRKSRHHGREQRAR